MMCVHHIKTSINVSQASSEVVHQVKSGVPRGVGVIPPTTTARITLFKTLLLFFLHTGLSKKTKNASFVCAACSIEAIPYFP